LGFLLISSNSTKLPLRRQSTVWRTSCHCTGEEPSGPRSLYESSCSRNQPYFLWPVLPFLFKGSVVWNFYTEACIDHLVHVSCGFLQNTCKQTKLKEKKKHIWTLLTEKSQILAWVVSMWTVQSSGLFFRDSAASESPGWLLLRSQAGWTVNSDRKLKSWPCPHCMLPPPGRWPVDDRLCSPDSMGAESQVQPWPNAHWGQVSHWSFFIVNSHLAFWDGFLTSQAIQDYFLKWACPNSSLEDTTVLQMSIGVPIGKQKKIQSSHEFGKGHNKIQLTSLLHDLRTSLLHWCNCDLQFF
jgi:hypothetical protein